MAKDPALLWYPADYVSGTMGMTFEAKGAYMDLLMMQFSQGHLSEQTILNHVGATLWEVIRPKFDLDDRGQFFKARIDEEKQKRIKYTKSRNNNKEGKNQHTKNRSHDQVLTGHMENININENINIILNLINTKIPEAAGANQITNPILFQRLDSFLQTYPTFQDIAIWEQYLGKIRESDFLMGRGDETKQPPLAVSWICDPKNAMEVLDGKYINRPRRQNAPRMLV